MVPALAVGTIFADYVRACSEWMRVPSGFSWNASDMALIDAEDFTRFVE